MAAEPAPEPTNPLEEEQEEIDEGEESDDYDLEVLRYSPPQSSACRFIPADIWHGRMRTTTILISERKTRKTKSTREKPGSQKKYACVRSQ